MLSPAPIRFVHTADLHLGKAFGNLESADRLKVARTELISDLANAARAHEAAHVLIAGDLFDAANPAAQTWRQALATMAEATDLTWWLLPGNHDNLSQGQATWDGIAALEHPNVHVLQTAEPREMQPGAFLLPSPLTTRRPPADPTDWMDSAKTPDGAIRIGLAHGPIQSFGETTLPVDLIAPNRDTLAKLDWLALGDWHGEMKVSKNAGYSGAPERTGFKHNGRGVAYLVDIAGHGNKPTVEPIPIGTFDWQVIDLHLVPGDDPKAMIEEKLPPGARRDMLVKVIANGRLPMRDASRLAQLTDEIGPDFCHFEVDTKGLGTEIETGDLDDISVGGALREAANALAETAADQTLAEGERDVAKAALGRLHSLVQEVSG
ncbi:MAG: metallophosphoesterase family protein [Paracoccaceae bacterium]